MFDLMMMMMMVVVSRTGCGQWN